MSYKTELLFHPLFEFVSSLSVFLGQKSYYEIDKRWYQTIAEKLNPEFKRIVTNKEMLDAIGYLHVMILECPQKETLSDFLTWFKNKSAGEIYEILLPYGGSYIPEDLSSFRDYFVKLLLIWSEAYAVEASHIQSLEKSMVVLEEKGRAMPPVDFVEYCTKGIRIHPIEKLKKVILVPTHFMTPMNRIYEFKDTAFVHFSVDRYDKDPTVPSIGLLRKTKALADAKRLRILQILSDEAKTFTELRKKTNLSKSNLHYHLTLLRAAGLIRITNYMFTEQDRYETRPNGFEALHSALETYVFKK